MYRAWVEEVLGLQVVEQMRINPVIPRSGRASASAIRHGETIYEIQVENPHSCERGVAWVEMDGQLVAGGVIPMERGLVKHKIRIRMGEPL